ncbi:MAG: AI-2E family transporter [Planctomycetes bacterium]|nr:AI-2E family transporter [Planctomycetota bacterium]
MSWFERRNHRLLFLSVLALGLGVFFYWTRSIVNPLLIALLVAYVLDPVVAFLERRRVQRVWSVSGIYVAAALVLVPLGWLGVSAAFYSADELIRDLRADYYPRLVEFLTPRLVRLQERFGDDPEVRGYLDRALARLKEPATAQGLITSATEWGALAARQLLSWVGRGVNLATVLVLVPIYAFFLLLNWRGLLAAVRDHLPGLHRERVLGICRQIDRAISAFFRGRLIIALVKGVLTVLGLWLVGVRFAPLIGMSAGVLSVVPFLGPVVGFLPAATLAILDHPESWPTYTLGVLAVFVAVEVIEGAILTPFILGSEVGIHPLTLILGLMIGGELLGLFGLLVAVPLISVCKILGKEFVLPPLRALAAERDPRTADQEWVQKEETRYRRREAPPGGTGGTPAGRQDGAS